MSLKLSIIVPVFNEGAKLTDVLEHLLKVDFGVTHEWVFVDDGSSDETPAILGEATRLPGVRVLRHEVNRGKGSAVAHAIEAARGEFIVVQDADFEYDPNDIPMLLKPLLEGKADVVYGSRFKSGAQVHRTFHYFVNRVLTLLSNLFSGIYLTDMETCYKLFRADLVKSMNLRSRRFGVEVELTAYVAKVRARIFELPISYFPRSHLQGKKITWRDGFAALWHLVRFNLLVSPEEAFGRRPEILKSYGDRPYYKTQ